MTPLQYAMKRMEEEAKNGGFDNTAADPYGIVDMFKQLYLGKNRPIGWLPDKNSKDRAVRNLYTTMKVTQDAHNEMYDADIKTLDAAGYQKVLIGGATEQHALRDNFDRDKYFDRQIDKWEDMRDGTRIKVGVLNEGSALYQVGFPAEGMWFDVGKIKKSFGKHGDHLTKAVLKEIPNLLNDPIAITEYRGPEGNINNTVNVFGMFMPDGKTPIVVGVMMTKAVNGSTIINKIRTIHAHGNADINDNNILYLNEDKKRTRRWFQVCGNSVPLNGTKFGLIRRIPYTDIESQEQYQLRDAGVSDCDVLKQAALDVKEKNAGSFTEEQKSALFIFQARLHKLETGEAKRQELLNGRDPKAVTGNERAELRKIQNNLDTVNAQLKRFDEELLKVER